MHYNKLHTFKKQICCFVEITATLMRPIVMPRHRTLALFIVQEPATYLMINGSFLEVPQKETIKLYF